MSSNLMIQVKDINKVYKNGDIENKVLKGINLEINQGEFVGIVGDSGSGKTTLMNLLGAMDSPDSGEIFIQGTNITKLSNEEKTLFRRKNIGFIFQDYNLVPVLNVYENIMLPIELNHMTIDENRLNLLFKILKLETKKYCLLNQLSGGEQQRVAIIRAIIFNPSLILADEPTGNLDRKNTEEVVHLLKGLCKKLNQTTIVVTHNENVAKQCDRVIRIQDGMNW